MAFIPKSKNEPWRGKRTAHARRKKPNQKFYNSARWRRSAKAKEASNPFCEDCADQGIVTDATGRNGVTDHVYSVNDAFADYEVGKINSEKLQWYLYHPDNQRRLCHTHHNSKSGKEAHRGKD